MNTKLKYIALCACGLALATSAFAQFSTLNKSDQAQVSYCYGIYQGNKNPKEVQKNSQLLENYGKTYTLIKNNPAFNKGLSDAKKASAMQKTQCYSIVYGFLGALYKLLGYDLDNNSLPLAYCMGYMSGATDGEEGMTSQACQKDDDGKLLNEIEKQACYTEFKTLLKSNTLYQKGKTESVKSVNPARVLTCGQLVGKASVDEIEKALTSPTTNNNLSSKNTGATTQKKVYPKQEKNTTIKPIF